MIRILLITSMVLIIVCACCASCSAAQASRLGSFTPCSVTTVDQLTHQIMSNPAVAARYAKHFGIPRDRLVRFLKEHVKIVTLSKTIKSETFYVTPTGKVISKVKTFPKGMRMFVTPDGHAIFDPRCGNPMVRVPSPRPTLVVENIQPLLPPKIEAAGSVEELPSFSHALAPVTTPVPVETPVVPAVIPAPIVAAAPAVTHAPGIKAAAPLLLGLVALHGSRGGEVVIPEPGTVVAACSVLGPVAFVFRRRKNRKPAREDSGKNG